MNRFRAVVAASMFTACSAVLGQTPELRIVERQGQRVVTPADSVLEFAVQMRVRGGEPQVLGATNFSIDVRFFSEPESRGVLARTRIMNPDMTYATSFEVNNIVGQGGIAAQYSYLAQLSSVFNGAINTSGFGKVNGPDQEIFLVTGFIANSTLIGLPGFDGDGDGQPDSWSGNGSGVAPMIGATAPIAQALGEAYFGANGHWVDIYRFRYTVTDLTPRMLDIRLSMPSNPVLFNRFEYGGSTVEWRPPSPASGPAAWSHPRFLIPVAATTIGACCDRMGGCTVIDAAQCSGQFMGGTCAASTCPPLGACCDADGTCATTFAPECNGPWNAGVACSPGICPGASGVCCSMGACLLSYAGGCDGTWQAQAVCGPSLCPAYGACCNSQGQCTLVVTVDCQGTFTANTACQPNPCPQPVACCDQSRGVCVGFLNQCPAGWLTIGQTCTPNPCSPVTRCCRLDGLCVVTTQANCNFLWDPAGTCTPDPCPKPGKCCLDDGSCSYVQQAVCTGSWTASSACSPGSCPQPGQCCAQNGTCTISLQAQCTGTWAQVAVCSPNPCVATGSCCVGSRCFMTDDSGCQQIGGVFLVGGMCGPIGNPTTCCRANFNMTSGVTPQDIFDFLNAWFLNEPSADFDNSGSRTPLDISVFLSAWFAGC